MGRKRITRDDLPERVYFQHNAYYFVDLENRWHWLGRVWDRRAIQKYSDLVIAPDVFNRLSGIMDQFMRHRLEQVKAGQLSARHYQNNEKEIKPLRAVFGHMYPTEVLPTDIYAYMDARPRVAANREKALLSMVFKFCIKKGLVNDNPCRLVQRNPEKPREREVKWSEFDAVYVIASPAMQCAMDIAWMTALREGVILKLKFSDFKQDGLHAETNKRKKRGVYEWNDGLRQVYEKAKSAHKIASFYLIANKEGQPYTQDGFRSNWRKLIQKALKQGLIEEPFTYHDLRSLAADEAENPTELLQHDDPKTTRRIYRRRAAKLKTNHRILDNP